MFNPILAHLDTLNFIIAFLALLASIYSICYTRRFNRRRIVISDGTIDCSGKFPLISFSIINPSPASITIEAITFADAKNKAINPLEYTPSLNLYEIPQFADPPSFPCVLTPYENVEPSYYINASLDCLNVTVVCKERIFRFKKQQTFSLHLSDITD